MRSDEMRPGLPGWISAAFDASYACFVKTPGSGLKAEIPASHQGLKLTHVGHELLAYWHWARGDKAMPDAGDIRPGDMRELLPYIRYMSWEAPDRLVFRVFGGALAAALGTDLTGSNILDLIQPKQMDDEMTWLRVLHAHPCGVLHHRQFYSLSGEGHPVEIVNLPVAAGSDGRGRVLSTVMALDAPQPWQVAYDRTRAMDRLTTVAIDLGAGIPQLKG